jgi:transposase InsO family protein
MKQEQQEEIARFRFGVISDLVGGMRLEPGEEAGIIRDKTLRRYDIPFSPRTSISASTMRRWVRLYENSGRDLKSLYPSGRSDQNSSRAVDDETICALVRLRKGKPSVTTLSIIAEMKHKNLITPGVVLSQSTAYRILEREGLSSRKTAAKVDRRRYEAQWPNDIWQSDNMHGPRVSHNDKQRKSYLTAILDDNSRMIICGRFYLSEKTANLLEVFHKALTTRGLPRKLYVDNGAAFSSKHLEKVCASLGIALVHTPPYTPQGRGKIERFFRTVRTSFLPELTVTTLDDLNQAFEKWLTRYHQRVHSSTGKTPFERFTANMELIRTAPSDIMDHFRQEARRRVAKDRTISLNGRLFEAPVQLIGEYVRLQYHDQKPDRVEVFYQGKSYGLLDTVDLKINCTVTRKRDKDEIRVEQHSASSGQLSFGRKTGGNHEY